MKSQKFFFSLLVAIFPLLYAQDASSHYTIREALGAYKVEAFPNQKTELSLSKQFQIYPYINVFFFIPGVGTSIRVNGFDFSGSVQYLDRFYSQSFFIPNFSASKLFSLKSSQNYFLYGSAGIGVGFIGKFPAFYIPTRVGIQYDKKIFVDIGANLLYIRSNNISVLPLPEIRFGLGF